MERKKRGLAAERGKEKGEIGKKTRGFFKKENRITSGKKKRGKTKEKFLKRTFGEGRKGGRVATFSGKGRGGGVEKSLELVGFNGMRKGGRGGATLRKGEKKGGKGEWDNQKKELFNLPPVGGGEEKRGGGCFESPPRKGREGGEGKKAGVPL